MNVFISEMLKTMGIDDSQKLNCCRTQGTIIDDTKVGFSLTLPDGTTVEIYTPSEDSVATDDGYAYLPDYDCESPDMCAEDLGDWVDDALNCCKRIDAYYESIRGRETTLNSDLSPELATRIKDVFRAAQSAVDLLPGFRYTAFRENKGANLILSTLMYTSTKLNATQWVAKSSLGVDTEEAEATNADDWSFEPNYNPDSEGHLIYHRPGRFIDIEQGMYGFTAEGDTPDKRDRKAAYWLAGLLSDMVDSMLQNPPARCYEFFLADGIAELKKSDLDRMSTPGIMRLVTKGYVDPEKVLKAKPTLAKDLVQKGLVTPEIVARRVPERLLWLVQSGYISPDYAVKVDPSIKDKLVRKGLYTVSENIPDDPTAILEGVKSGAITPVDAYRKNPKLLQTMVEQSLVTPQEAYKLDASIVTWLLLNHYIGREEAAKVKPDIQKYIARKYKDVNWEDLDASTEDLQSKISKLREAFKKRQGQMKKAEQSVDDANAEILKKAAKIREAALNSSSDESEEWEYVASKDVYDWDGFLTEYTWYRNADGYNVFVFGDPDLYGPEDGEWDYDTENAELAENWFKTYEGAGDKINAKRQAVNCNKKPKRALKKKTAVRKRPKLNSSMGFNGSASEEDNSNQYTAGYEPLSQTTAEGSGFVAEVMLPEDNFDGIVVPGDTEEIAKETLTQMLLANDGTFIDWKPVDDIQAFKAENADKNILVLN